MELAEIYAGAQERVVRMAEQCGLAGLALRVPGTPEWTVSDVVAHLAGVTSDFLNGRLDGVATPAWTARQVDQRRGRAVAEVLAEWAADAPEMQARLAASDQLAPVAIDALTHEHDLRGALGRPGASDPEAVGAVLQRLGPVLGGRFNQAGLPGLRMVSGENDEIFGSAPVGACVSASPMELFRALFGRRSAAQVRAFAWAGDPGPYLGLLNLFGPLPPEDVLEAT